MLYKMYKLTVVFIVYIDEIHVIVEYMCIHVFKFSNWCIAEWAGIDEITWMKGEILMSDKSQLVDIFIPVLWIMNKGKSL